MIMDFILKSGEWVFFWNMAVIIRINTVSRVIIYYNLQISQAEP